MPAVLIIGPYRFFFYSSDRSEPPHVHIERGSDEAKFWLDPVRLQFNSGFNRRELNRIKDLIQEHIEQLLSKWDDHFTD